MRLHMIPNLLSPHVSPKEAIHEGRRGKLEDVDAFLQILQPICIKKEVKLKWVGRSLKEAFSLLSCVEQPIFLKA